MEGPHWRQIEVKMPHNHSAPDLSLRREASILVMRPMIVASGELRSHPQHRSRLLLTDQLPSHNDNVAAVDRQDLPLDRYSVAVEGPGRPGVC